MATPWSRRIGTWAPAAVLVAVVLVGAVLVAFGLVSSPTGPARPVVVASGDWEPYVGPDLDDGGPAAELVGEVLERMGYAPEVRFTTWSLALQRTRQETVLGTFPFVGSSERRSDYLLSDELLEFDYVLFVRAGGDRPAIEAPADIAGLRVARIDGYEYWPALNDAVADQGDYLPYATKEDAFEALWQGDVDVVPEGLLSGQAVLTSADFSGDASGITHLPPGGNPLLGSRESLHFMMSPSAANREFLAEFDDQLAAVKQSDLYRRLAAALTDADSLTVTLQPMRGQGVVRLTDAAGRTVLTPSGTSVRVVDWPEAFTVGVEGGVSAPIEVSVKVLDGPSQGRILTADARSLVIGSGS